MMKKFAIVFLALYSFSMAFCQNAAGSADTPSQERVARDSVAMFSVGMPGQSRLSEDAAELLSSKVSQILGRCNAGASGDNGPFIIEPTLTVGDKRQSEGMVQNVTVLSGELTLAAKQRYSGQQFHSATFPISTTLKGDIPDEEKTLAKAIKTSDAAFVRFIRNARKNILDYGMKHPEIWDVPDASPETVRDTAYVPIVILVEKENTPQPAQNPGQQPKPQSPANNPPSVKDIFVSAPNWNVMISESEYMPASRQIHIKMTVLNSNKQNYDRLYTRISKAIDTEGETYKTYKIDNSTRDYPYDVPVTMNFYIDDVYSNPGMIPFLEISIGNIRIEIRNLSVR